jgi:hypothetical protein
MKPSPDRGGYLLLRLSVDGKQYTKYVHRLVLKAFGPEQPLNTTVDHINRNRTDNRIENLRWATKQQQTDNAVLNPLKGSKNGTSKLTESDIPKIRQLLSMGITQRRIAEQFDVVQGIISNIKNNKNWSHVQDKIT